MATARRVAVPRRGDVFVVRFDPTLGAEIQKTRPALVLQNDIANRFSPITIVAGITSQFDSKLYPTEVLIKAPEGGLEHGPRTLTRAGGAAARRAGSPARPSGRRTRPG